MRLKRIGCSLLAVFLSLQLAVPVNSYGAVRLSDIKGHWAEDYIEKAVDKNIITGYPDGRFLPDRAVTRAEFAAMINNALGNNGMAEITFRDVKGGDWYYNDVAKALAATYTAGYDDDTFRPASPITRQEAAVMIARIVPAYGEEGNLRAYPDRSSIADWAYDSLEKVSGKGYIGAYNDGRIHPLDRLTRAQAAKIICEILDEETIVSRNTVVDEDGDRLANRIYSNNVTVDEDLDDDSAVIENCTILGTLSVRGGGTDSVTVSNSRIANTNVNKDDDPVRLIAKGETAIVRLSAYESSILQTSGLKGGPFGPGFSNITIGSSAEVTLRGSFPRVNVSGARAQLVLESGKIETLTVGGRYSHITADRNTTISTATVNAESYFHGSGAISQMNVNADDVTYETKPKKWSIASSADTPKRMEAEYEDISFSPKNGAKDVRLDAEITITFDDAMELYDGDSISNSDLDDFIELRKDSLSGSLVGFSASVGSSKKVITIDPDSDLVANTKYYLIIEKNSIRERNGSAVAKQTVSFTTGDDYNKATPALSSFSVTSGDTSITAKMTPNTAGRIYAIAVPAGSAAPKAEQIVLGRDSAGAKAQGYAKNENVTASAQVTLPAMGGLLSGISYDVWATLYSNASGTYSTPVKQNVTTTTPRITLSRLSVKPYIGGTAGDNQISFKADTYNYTVGLNSSITDAEAGIEGPSGSTVTLSGKGLGTINGSEKLTSIVNISANPVLTVTVSAPGRTSSSYTVNLNAVNDTSLKSLKIAGAAQALDDSDFSYELAGSGAASITLDIETRDKYAVITEPSGNGVAVNKVSGTPGVAGYILALPEGSYPVAVEFNVVSGGKSAPTYTLTFTRP